MQRPHTSFEPDRLEGGLAAPGWTPGGTTSDYLEDITQRRSDTFSVTPGSGRTQGVHVTLGSPKAAALAAGHLSPGLTALGIEGAERLSIMQRVSREVVGMSASQAKAHIDSVLKQLAQARRVTNLDELIEAEVNMRKAAAVPYTL